MLSLVFARPPGTPLSGAEARRLLIGNTFHGSWEGSLIHLYLNPNGTLLYKPEAKPALRGRWVLKENELCWGTGQTNNCSTAHIDDKQYWMKLGVSTYYPFEVLKGNQVPR